MSRAGEEYLMNQDRERPSGGRPGLEKKVQAILNGMHSDADDPCEAIADLLALLILYGMPRE